MLPPLAMHKKRILIIFSILLIICFHISNLYSQVIDTKPTGFVNDYAGIIKPNAKTDLENILGNLEKASSIEIAVVTVSSLNGTPIEDYGVELFKKWGIGKKGKDNGLLILVAPKEKKIRFEVGYGLEGYMTDAMSGRIIRNTIIPWFKQGDFSTGILNGTVESINVLNEKMKLGFDVSKAANLSTYNLKTIPKTETSLFGKIFKFLVILFFIFVFIKNPFAGLFLLMGMGGSGRHRSSGGFSGGGGFGGFGGGMSGGGGATGSW